MNGAVTVRKADGSTQIGEFPEVNPNAALAGGAAVPPPKSIANPGAPLGRTAAELEPAPSPREPAPQYVYVTNRYSVRKMVVVGRGRGLKGGGEKNLPFILVEPSREEGPARLELWPYDKVHFEIEGAIRWFLNLKDK